MSVGSRAGGAFVVFFGTALGFSVMPSDTGISMFFVALAVCLARYLWFAVRMSLSADLFALCVGMFEETLSADGVSLDR